MSDSWAQDIAREELITSSQGAAGSSTFADSPLVSPVSFGYYFGDLDTDYGTPSTSDDGYDTACSPEVISNGMMSTKGRKRKRVENSWEEERNKMKMNTRKIVEKSWDVERKKIKKNGCQRNRKKEERYYMEALKKIFIQNGYIKTTTPKRSITHFETLKIAEMKINEFINKGVPHDRMKQICDEVLEKS